jgi:hypothetical protein
MNEIKYHNYYFITMMKYIIIMMKHYEIITLMKQIHHYDEILMKFGTKNIVPKI